MDNRRRPDEPADAEVAAVLAALEQVTLTLSFDPDDPASIEAALGEMDARIDAAIAPFHGHPFVEAVARQIKDECRYRVLEQIATGAAAGSSRTLH
ncbi:hypothetical protein VSR68_30800 [Paraburkholderia phymatum]|uniref:hypothetical protein n=1 Tax=Paraburkholderia phymatum TaxID=148447 RepID=UPI00317B6522